MTALLLLTAAFAQDPTLSTPQAPPAALGEVKRQPLMELNLRGRWMGMPDSILDIWFFDSDVEGANQLERPNVRGASVGIEYVLKPRPSNWVFYYEYMGSLMGEGYWDDAESPADHNDGSWIEPSRLGLHGVGVNYLHEVALTPEENQVWLSMLFGGGLGGAFVVGDMKQWLPGGNPDITNDCLRQSPAFARKDACPADPVVRLPRALPIVDISTGFRINFADRASVRLDAGFHNLFYVGTSVGGVF